MKQVIKIISYETAMVFQEINVSGQSEMQIEKVQARLNEIIDSQRYYTDLEVTEEKKQGQPIPANIKLEIEKHVSASKTSFTDFTRLCALAEYGYNLAKSSVPRWIKASERVPDTIEPVYVRFDGFKDVAYFENNKWLYAANDEPLYPAFTRNIEWLYEPETT